MKGTPIDTHHPLDKTPAGRALDALRSQMLGFMETLHPENWRELAEKHFVPMSNDMMIRGAKWAGDINDAEAGGRELTAHDIVIVGWAYLCEGIHKNRGA